MTEQPKPSQMDSLEVARRLGSEVEYVPFRPSQNQADVTEAITGVKMDLECCVFCGAVRGVGDHHVVFRSHGGEDGPTVPVCQRCHDKVHDRYWFPELTEEGIFLNDPEGQVIWRLLRWPLPGEPGAFVQQLDGIADVMKLMPEVAPALLSWQAVEVFNSLRDVGESGWRAQTRLIGEMHAYRLPHLKGPEKIEALCATFGIRRSQAHNYISLAREFGASTIMDETPLSMGFLIEATKAKNPEGWVKHAEDRKAQHPQYSRDDLKREIITAGDRVWPPAEEPKVTRVWTMCTNCGKPGWNEKLPVGADGKPVELE